jgi:hypothetical protein
MAVEHATDAGTAREALYRLLKAERPTRERLREAVRLGCAHLDVESCYVLRHCDDGRRDRRPRTRLRSSRHTLDPF